MEPEDWPKIKAIFDSAILVAADERNSYLENACAGNAELRREVEGLLSAFHAAEGFMEKPFAGEIAGLFADDDADELKPGDLFTHYKIVQRIGVGGMGTVYLAEDTHLKRMVAIKLLSSDATRDHGQVSRFVQEARYASLLNHPNILTIYEIGQTGDLHFISSEFIPGETLRSRLDGAPFNAKEAIDIAIDVASALVAAHARDIVHRDIKPENIMLREDGLLKVLDFGLAKLNRHERCIADPNTEPWAVKTEPGLIVGTVTYMSPEQASGIEVDGRTDIWSLGVVLYEMLRGRAPFEGSSPAGVIAAILRDEPKPVKQPSPNLGRKVRQIIRRSLAKDPDGRYPTVQEMLDDLKCLRSEIESGTVESRSIAILPFVNITGDASISFFEFALADAVTTQLARSGSLLVRPSLAVAKYLGKAIDPLVIGKELRVDAILAANFLLTKNRIRVTTQLIDVVERNVLWGEQIDSEADDIMGLQDTITHRIVEGLRGELETSAPPSSVTVPATDSSLAYMEYLRGRDQLRRYMFQTVANENLSIAIEHYKRAIALDEKFALAHCALGTSYLQRVIKVVGNREDLEAAAAALDHALALNPEITDARAYRAVITRLQGETQRSRDELAELRRVAPNNFDVQYLSAACYRFDGDYEGSFRCFTEMLRIDPTAKVAVHYCRARIFWYLGKFDHAFRELHEAEKLEPNHPIVKFFHAIVTFLAGDPAVALEEMKSLLAVYPRDGFRPCVSICLLALGEREAALRELNEETERIGAVDPDVSHWLASAYFMAGRIDTAFTWLKCSVRLGNHNLRWFERDPTLAPWRGDQRFIDLVSDMKRSSVF